MEQITLATAADSEAEARRQAYSHALAALPEHRTPMAFHELAAHLVAAACGAEPQNCDGPVFYARYFLDRFLHVRIERDRWGHLRAFIASR